MPAISPPPGFELDIEKPPEGFEIDGVDFAPSTVTPASQYDESGLPVGISERERKRLELSSKMAAAQKEAIPIERRANLASALDYNPLDRFKVTSEDLQAPDIPRPPWQADLSGPHAPMTLPERADSSLTPVMNGERLGRPELPTQEPPEQDRVSGALFNAVLQQAGGLVSPENLAILASTYGLGALGKAGQILQRGVSGTFAVEGAKAFKDSLDELNAAKTKEDKASAWVKLLASGGMTVGAGMHALSPIPKEIVRNYSDKSPTEPTAPEVPKGAADADIIDVETVPEKGTPEIVKTAVEAGEKAGLTKSVEALKNAGVDATKTSEGTEVSAETPAPIADENTEGKTDSVPSANGERPAAEGSGATTKKAPEPDEPIPGEKLMTVERPDGTTYKVSFADKYWDEAKTKPSVARLVEGQWSHGMLKKGEKFVEPKASEPIEPVKAVEASGDGVKVGDDIDKAMSSIGYNKGSHAYLVEGEQRVRLNNGAVVDFDEKTRKITAVENKSPEPGPGMVGMGAAVPSNLPKVNPIQTVIDLHMKPLRKARAQLSQLWSSRGVRDIIAASRDAVENSANIYGRRMANEIQNSLRRTFGKDRAKADSALTAFIEAGGTEEGLIAGKDKLQNSTVGSPLWRRRAIQAHDFALYNMEKLRPIADAYNHITEQQVADENASGIDTLKHRNYVMHAQDIDEPLSSGGGAGNATGFRKNRVHATFADSIAAGVDPHTLSATDLLNSRLRSGQQMINKRAWVDSLKELKDPQSGQSIVTQPEIVTRADNSTYPSAPQGYELQQLGNQQVAVHQGYEGLLSALTDPSAFSKSIAGRNFLKLNGAGKSISLLIDTFHLGRLAYWQSLIKSLGVSTFETPFPSYKKGVTLLDNTVPEIRRMVANGEVSPKILPELLESKRRLDGLVKSGFNVGRINDALHQELIQDIPFIGGFNKFVFDQFQRGAMSEIGLLELERIKRARPEMLEAEQMRAVAKDLNTRFGNLGRQGIFKSKTFQDIARTLLLAPQWNEGLIRSELGAVKQAGELVKDTAQGKRIYTGVLLRSVGAMAVGQFVANQLLNYYTRGHPTWENKEEGLGAKLSAWIPDKVGGGPGFFLHPLGLAAETTHLIMQKYEKNRDFLKTLREYARSRTSVAMRPILTWITGEDALGKKIKPDNLAGEMMKAAIPSPIGSSAVVQAGEQLATGEKRESFPGQFQKQLMASGGVKTEQSPSAGQRISSLASQFNKAKGITPSAEYYEGDYVPLTRALGVGNKKDALEALADIEKKKTAQQIVEYFKRYPKHVFTGQKAREKEFFNSLTPEQQDAYREALKDRRDTVQKFLTLYRERLTTARR